MKKVILPLFLLSSVAGFAQDTGGGGLFKKASGLLNKAKGGSLSNDDIVAGLKEALSVGATNGANKLSAVDGFFANAAIKVLLPPEAQKVEKTLRAAGMGKLVDDAILSMNRAAEDASKSAAPIFLDAVKTMSFQDALGILKGSDTAATGYLRGKTVPALTAAFRPVIEGALEKTGATRHWKTVFETYNKLPTSFNKVNPDLSGYVTEKALGGMFFQVAQEEQKIRKDPAARVTETLKKVFGS
ncbi:DUF4197 domain-containing protein [Paraflavitalea sp. CAU 1676]|uniref:DUF4197 domain-containing protein n=1 Tax=Paraflavitalea sp. CAU 1676 TaxID=3032598 RepID=UPI0023DB04E5|nr:DUF4197 domain-containing protein [Paraflavitalea sp. CAU 1676]MDF2189990.1 DUF4197 domain-containing protein [Paraflavitalea sp. CAU 1676]